jgi:hypothetical protein
MNKEVLDLYFNIDQMELTNIYSIFHPTVAEYTFFSQRHIAFFPK